MNLLTPLPIETIETIDLQTLATRDQHWQYLSWILWVSAALVGILALAKYRMQDFPATDPLRTFWSTVHRVTQGILLLWLMWLCYLFLI